MKIYEIFDYIDMFAPFNTQCEWDNAGLLVGDKNEEVKKVCICLDITVDSVNFAKENGCNLMISHHPVIFLPLSDVEKNSPVDLLCRYGISAICVHTNLDAAKDGVNDTLGKLLGFDDVEVLDDNTENPIPRTAKCKTEMTAFELASLVRQKLGCENIQYVDTKRKIKTVALCGGAGGDAMKVAIKSGCDALITADIKHHEWLYAVQKDFCLIDAGHYCTENPVIFTLENKLKEKFENLKIEVYKGNAPMKFI